MSRTETETTETDGPLWTKVRGAVQRHRTSRRSTITLRDQHQGPLGDELKAMLEQL